MLTRIQIDGLRGISNADIDGLAPVTILLGANGSGKSTVLEAIGVACAGHDVASAFGALAHREWLGLEGMRFWFTGADRKTQVSVCEGTEEPTASFWLLMGGPIFPDDIERARRTGAQGELVMINGAYSIAYIDEDGAVFVRRSDKPFRPFTLETTFVDRPAAARKRFAGERFSSALREALSQIKLTPYYDDLIEYLQILRPKLISIESLAVGDRDEPFIFEKEPRIGYPLAYAGDGFRRTLQLAAALARTKGGVVAIDEPEAFAHPKLFASLAKLIRRAVDEGTQVFLATHSLELVEATLVEHQDEPEKVAVVCLSNDRGVLDPLVITGPNAYRRVVERGDDLRL